MIARAALLAVLAVSPAAGRVPAVVVDQPEQSRQARSDYLEHCAGCHGVSGTSVPARVPELRGRIGHFLCTREGRDYLVRLPNVAHAPLADPAALAALLNYVVFDLGGDSAPPNAAPYRAAEVAALRQHPLVRGSLVKERARLVTDIRRRCRGVPASLEHYGAPPGAILAPR